MGTALASFQEVKKARRPIVLWSSDDFWHIGNPPVFAVLACLIAFIPEYFLIAQMKSQLGCTL